MKLTLYTDTQSFDVRDKDILLLELALNNSIYGHGWSTIGDYLYNFYVKEDCIGQPIDRLEVTSEQYTFLLDLFNHLS